MRFAKLLPTFLASGLVTATPVQTGDILDHLARDDVHVFKRDAPLDARDLEDAKRHNIDLNEMFKHSIIKRDDGDHVTLWLHNSWTEDSESASGGQERDIEAAQLNKRQSSRVNLRHGYKPNTEPTPWCVDYQYRGDTGPNAPYTGGPNAVVRWGDTCTGKWEFSRLKKGDRRNIIVAGSNSGANMRFTIGPDEYDVDPRWPAVIGCRDIRELTKTSLDRYRRTYSGSERVRARGTFRCGPIDPAYVDDWFWAIDSSNERVS